MTPTGLLPSCPPPHPVLPVSPCPVQDLVGTMPPLAEDFHLTAARSLLKVALERAGDMPAGTEQSPKSSKGPGECVGPGMGGGTMGSSGSGICLGAEPLLGTVAWDPPHTHTHSLPPAHFMGALPPTPPSLRTQSHPSHGEALCFGPEGGTAGFQEPCPSPHAIHSRARVPPAGGGGPAGLQAAPGQPGAPGHRWGPPVPLHDGCWLGPLPTGLLPRGAVSAEWDGGDDTMAGLVLSPPHPLAVRGLVWR